MKGGKFTACAVVICILIGATIISVGTASGLQMGISTNKIVSNITGITSSSIQSNQNNDVKNTNFSNNDVEKEFISNAMEQIKFLYKGETDILYNKSFYAPINVPMGKKIIGTEGTELILRSGSARGYTSQNTENGIIDVTRGIDLLNGDSLNKNCLVIVPRDDERGVLTLSDCWFLVRGDYKIE